MWPILLFSNSITNRQPPFSFKTIVAKGLQKWHFRNMFFSFQGTHETATAFDVFLEILRGASLQRAELTAALGQEFVYVKKKASSPYDLCHVSPYDLELVPFQTKEHDETNYATLSPAGLTHYVKGEPKSFVPLQRWLNERRSYEALRQLRFFQECRVVCAKENHENIVPKNSWVTVILLNS